MNFGRLLDFGPLQKSGFMAEIGRSALKPNSAPAKMCNLPRKVPGTVYSGLAD